MSSFDIFNHDEWFVDGGVTYQKRESHMFRCCNVKFDMNFSKIEKFAEGKMIIRGV